MSSGRSKSLWGNSADDDGAHGWLDPEPAPRPPSAEPSGPTGPGGPSEPPRRGRFGLRTVATFFAIAVIAVGAVFVGDRLVSSNDATVADVTLPVVKGTTPETRAGEIYRQVQSGVVQIRTGNASGTGFVVAQDGTIVTNAHVVDGATDVKVFFDDGDSSVDGRVLGRDVSSDLAVVKVDPNQAGKLTVLSLADSDKVKTGDEVIAIGYPLGLDRTATQGIVSGIGRQIRAQNGFSIDKVIQTDASINPGNSGGPLLDARGRVIGVNSQIAATSSGGNTGIGFSIPSNTVRDAVPELVKGKTLARPYLGVSLQPTDDDSGALVYETTRGAPAEQAGLQPGATGDVIQAIDGEKIGDPDALIEKLDDHKPGDTVTLTVRRDGQQREVQIKLAQRPDNATADGSMQETP